MRIFIRWLINLFRQSGYRLKFVDEIPEKISDKCVFVECNSGKDENYYAYFSCPCGCGDILTLNLIPDVSPVWRVDGDKGDFSIYPSVWRTNGCKSHFWIRNNNVRWV